jgi:hypothetical protein
LEKEYLIRKLKEFRERLLGEVINAYEKRGSSFGAERYSSFQKSLYKFLDENMPGESQRLEEKLTIYVLTFGLNEKPVETFWRISGEKTLSFIDSLILDIERGEHSLDSHIESEPFEMPEPAIQLTSSKILPFYKEWWFISLLVGVISAIVLIVISFWHESDRPIFYPVIAGTALFIFFMSLNPKKRFAKWFNGFSFIYSSANIMPAFKGYFESKSESYEGLFRDILFFAVEGPPWHFNICTVILLIFLLYFDQKERSD